MRAFIEWMRKLMRNSYAWDWIGVAIVFAIVGILEVVPPFERLFFLDDESISYPHREQETIPTWLLFVRGY